MSKHHFIETKPQQSVFYRLIYCEWCGIVVWNSNANHNTTPTLKEYQEQAGDGCKAYVDTAPTEQKHQPNTKQPNEEES